MSAAAGAPNREPAAAGAGAPVGTLPSTVDRRPSTTPADALAVAAAGAVAAAALARGNGAALYCCHCRTCNRTLEHCPAGITAQDELAVAARDGDHARFVRFGGMACLRCGACETRCDARLPLARMFAAAQVAAAAAVSASVPAPALVAACREALGNGLVGPEYLAPVVAVVRRVAPGDA